jgi:CheY-like chemotaxis protein
VEQALALIRSQAFDVAMLDMNVAGIKSHPVADALMERGIPFAFATGYSGHDMRETYSQVPMLNKPFHLDALRSALASLIRQ